MRFATASNIARRVCACVVW